MWKLTIIFSNRPFIGNVINMDMAQSFTMELLDQPDPTPAPAFEQESRQARVHVPARIGDVFREIEQARRPTRNLQPTGSFPKFEKPQPRDGVSQEDIDNADEQGYLAYASGVHDINDGLYPPGVLKEAWQNGYARAEHSDARNDDDE